MGGHADYDGVVSKGMLLTSCASSVARISELTTYRLHNSCGPDRRRPAQAGGTVRGVGRVGVEFGSSYTCGPVPATRGGDRTNVLTQLMLRLPWPFPIPILAHAPSPGVWIALLLSTKGWRQSDDHVAGSRD